MKCYLLFDSGCSLCSRIARAVEAETENLLEIRSLREIEIQRILAQVDSNWRWKPTLVVIGGSTRLYTGIQLNMKLVQILGFKKAFRVASLVNKAVTDSRPYGSFDAQRRQVLKGITILPLALFFGMPGWKNLSVENQDDDSPNNLALTELPPTAEFYEGFLLLPADSPRILTSCVDVPVICGAGVSTIDPVVRGEGRPFTRLAAAQEAVSFPLYTLDVARTSALFHSAKVLQFESNKKVFSCTVSFFDPHSQNRSQRPSVHLTVMPEFPHPYPIYAIRKQADAPEIWPEKVDFTPNPGVMIPTMVGNILHWIEEDTLFTLEIEHSRSSAVTQNIARMLRRLGNGPQEDSRRNEH